MHLSQNLVKPGLDGAVGPRTLAAVRAANPATLIASMGEQSEQHYRSLNTFDVFGGGWMNRIDRPAGISPATTGTGGRLKCAAADFTNMQSRFSCHHGVNGETLGRRAIRRRTVNRRSGHA